jgi:uncharacterized ion transporter superfamily protein YfcC
MTKGLPTDIFHEFRSSLCVSTADVTTAGGVRIYCIVYVCVCVLLCILYLVKHTHTTHPRSAVRELVSEIMASHDEFMVEDKLYLNTTSTE